jgi:Sec-independent protein secretion pathway component TatC
VGWIACLAMNNAVITAGRAGGFQESEGIHRRNGCLIFGLIFELPIVALLPSRFGLVNRKLLTKKRKYALLARAIISVFHVDLITMFVVMIPLYLMHETSVWVSYVFAGQKPA